MSTCSLSLMWSVCGNEQRGTWSNMHSFRIYLFVSVSSESLLFVNWSDVLSSISTCHSLLSSAMHSVPRCAASNFHSANHFSIDLRRSYLKRLGVECSLKHLINRHGVVDRQSVRFADERVFALASSYQRFRSSRQMNSQGVDQVFDDLAS